MRPIDANVVIEKVMNYCKDDDGTCAEANTDIRELLDEIENLPTIQPEPSIPLSWIEEQIERLKGLDNAFATLTAMQISAMVQKWRDEQDDS